MKARTGASLVGIMAMVAASPGLSGCAASPDGSRLVQPAINAEMVRAPETHIYLATINGASVPKAALDRALATLASHVQGKLVVDGPTDLKVKTDEHGQLDSWPKVTATEVPPSPGTLVLVFVPNVRSTHRGIYFRFDDGWQEVVFNARMIGEFGGVFVSESKAWEIVMIHELGHALGLPARASHRWHEGHCTNPACVLYPALDWRSVTTAAFHLGPPTDFGPACSAELIAVAAAR